MQEATKRIYEEIVGREEDKKPSGQIASSNELIE